MSRRNSAAAEHAAQQASDAARVLQQRGQEYKKEPAPEPEVLLSDERIEELRGKNPNTLAREEIIASRNSEPKAEEEKPVEKPVEKAPEAVAPIEAPETPAAEVVAPEAPKTVKQKVDGEEIEVPISEIEEAGGERAWRIQRASENRLNKANETLAESRRAQSEITQLATALLSQRQGVQAKPQETDEAFITSKMDTIRFGTTEESAKAQIEIVQRLAKPVDRNSIVAEATAYFHHDQAVKAFDKEFQDVVTNPIRLKAVVALRQERLDRHRIEKPNQSVDWDSFYRTIGTEVRSAFGGSSQAATPPAVTSGTPSQPQSEKEARKASIVNLPAAAAKAEMSKEDKPETREDILNNMRKQRGQLVG